jgi:phosphatidylserine/phosphatidylglycerophosphate/cardiolipin synthase-like enzyme
MRLGKRLTKRYIKYIFAVFFIIYVSITNIYARPEAYDAKVTFLPDRYLLDSMIKDVTDAQKNIFIAIYMFKTTDDRHQMSTLLEEALISALKKGVKVFVVMDLGKGNDITTDINKETAEELLKAGATVVFDSKDVRTHAKLMVIDEKITYVGSHNYTDSAFKYNNETTVRIVSEGLASDAIKYIKRLVR